MNKEELNKGIGLTDQEMENLLILADASLKYPRDASRMIAAAGIEPSPDPEVRVYQLIQAHTLDPIAFDAAAVEFNEETEEFLGGVGLALGKVAGAAAGLFKKRSDAEGGRRFLGKMFDKIKAKRQEKKAQKAAEAAGAMAAGLGAEAAEETTRTTRSTTTDTPAKSEKPMTAEEKKQEVEKLKKSVKTFQIVTAVLAASIIGVVVWAVRS